MIGTRLLTHLKKARKAGSSLEDLADLCEFSAAEIAEALGETPPAVTGANAVRVSTGGSGLSRTAAALKRAGDLQRDADVRAADAKAHAPKPENIPVHAPNTSPVLGKTYQRGYLRSAPAFKDDVNHTIETRFERAGRVARGPAVERIRPLTPQRLAFARRFEAAHWPIGDIAWLFDADPEALAAALERKAAA